MSGGILITNDYVAFKGFVCLFAVMGLNLESRMIGKCSIIDPSLLYFSL